MVMRILGLLYVLVVLLNPGLSFLRPEYFIAGIAAGWLLLTTSGAGLKIFRHEFELLGLLTLFAVLTLFRQGLVTNTFISRDWMILPRYVFYAAALLTGAAWARAAQASDRLHNAFVVSFALFVIAVTIAEYFNIGGINSFLLKLYKPSSDALAMGHMTRRPGGTLGNPNYWGFICGMLLLYCVYRVFVRREFLWFLLVAGLLLAIILTGSRTALIAPVGAWFVFATALAFKGQRKLLFLSAPLFVALALFSVGFAIASLGYEFIGRFSVENTDTLDLRLIHWQFELAKIPDTISAFILGMGPSKAVASPWADNMYLMLIRDFGYGALVVYGAFLIWCIRRLFQMYMSGYGRESLSAWALLAWLMMTIFNITADAWFNVQVASLVLLLHGYTVGSMHVRGGRRSPVLDRSTWRGVVKN